jgi:hypothetical protein
MTLDPSSVAPVSGGNTDLPAPVFDERSGAVHLWVRTGSGAAIGAILRREALPSRFRAVASAEVLQTYLAHRDEVDAAVLRRLAAGSLEPVLLREHDFTLRAEPGVPPPAQ